MKSKTAKHLEENIGKYLHKFGRGQNLLDGERKAQIIKGKHDQLEFIKIKDLCSLKILLREIKSKPQNGKTYLHYISIFSIPRYIKDPYKVIKMASVYLKKG